MTDMEMPGMKPEAVESVEYGIHRYRPEKGSEEITLKRYELRPSDRLAACVLFISEEEALRHADFSEVSFHDFRYGNESFTRLSEILHSSGR